MVGACNRYQEGDPIILRRSAALGDVVAATVVARNLNAAGYDVIFQSQSYCHAVLRYCPQIIDYEEIGRPCHIDLDGAYENSPLKKQRSFHEIFLDVAQQQLIPHGIQFIRSFPSPQLTVLPCYQKEVLTRLEPFPKPWVMMNPRSICWTHRTIQPPVWQAASAMINGTVFWIGLDPCPPGIVDLALRHVDLLVHYISCADCVVTTDTSPAHIAAALEVPLVVIYQSINPRLTVGHLANLELVASSMGCLNCQLLKCPIDPNYPPCQNVSPELIANAVNLKTSHVLQ